MPSKTSIANEALLRIGEARIASIEDTTDPNAVFLSSVWDTSLRQVSSEVPWKCLTARAVLSASATAPAFTWDVEFPLPVDCLRPLWFNGHSHPDNSYFAIEGGSILTDDTTGQLTYTAFSEDVTTYSPELIEALALLLASKLAFVRRQESQMSSELDALYRKLVQMRASQPSVAETKSLWLELGADSEIVVNALARIAEPRAVAFDDTTFMSATDAAVILASCKHQVISSFDWKCLCSRSTLTADVTAPEFGWDYRYELPEDCERIIEFNGKPTLDSDTQFRQEGDYLLTNASAVEVLYVAYSDDETDYDAMLKDVIAADFAYRMSLLRRKDAQLAASLGMEYERVASRARLSDSTQMHENAVDFRKRSYSIRARYGN